MVLLRGRNDPRHPRVAANRLFPLESEVVTEETMVGVKRFFLRLLIGWLVD